MDHFLWLHPSTITIIVHALVIVGVSLRVIMQRPATGVALAWLLLTAAIPLLGGVMYLLIGERRISRGRSRGIESLRTDFRQIAEAAVRDGITNVDWSAHPPAARSLATLGRTLLGSPAVCGSSYHLLSDTKEILAAIARDVEAANKSVLMEFYIWHEGGLADEVVEALIRAARRGVRCLLLVDALGARPWWRGSQPGRLRQAGVEVRPALRVGVFRSLLGRTDLRLHRKIVVVDGAIAWTGSMNLVDPRFFKQDAGVGEWVDAMARLEGAVVAPLAATLLGDWILESGDPLRELIDQLGLRLIEPAGPADMQVVASGPGESGDGLLQMILGLINAASRELVLTTPYLVPDDSLLRALRGAAARGVTVRLVVPERVDSLLTRYASRSYYDDLLAVGVEIYLYRGGLLHTKSIAVDGAISMFGTVNLDMRSIWLNYEVTLLVYDGGFATTLRALQQTYMDDSDRLDAASWSRRAYRSRVMENTMRLVSPLL